MGTPHRSSNEFKTRSRGSAEAFIAALTYGENRELGPAQHGRPFRGLLSDRCQLVVAGYIVGAEVSDKSAVLSENDLVVACACLPARMREGL